MPVLISFMVDHTGWPIKKFVLPNVISKAGRQYHLTELILFVPKSSC